MFNKIKGEFNNYVTLGGRGILVIFRDAAWRKKSWTGCVIFSNHDVMIAMFLTSLSSNIRNTTVFEF